jgi:hypothetical protein
VLRVVRERDIEAFLVKRVRALGGELRKVRWVGRCGAPDRRVMLEHKAPFWIELKAPGKSLSPLQLREHTRMRRLGESVAIADSFETIEDLLR